MTKTTYRTLRESIRTNGLRYTTRIAQESGNVAALTVIDALVNQCIKPTDWLTMRQRWIKTETPRNAFMLTVPDHILLIVRNHTYGKPNWIGA